jgi:glycolate oxidase iron-sulfur subunit
MTETSGPRGRISLIKSVAQGELDLLSPGFVHQMFECLDCRGCEAACPSGVAYGQLVETARAQIVRAQEPQQVPQMQLGGRLMRAVFGRPELMRAAASILRFAQQTRLISLAGIFGLANAARLVPVIPASFFSSRNRRIEAASPQGVAMLHTGCIMPVAFPSVHEATLRMLLRGGLSVVVPSDQGCCGAIAVHAGDPGFARELAKRNILAFERSGADVYVVNAAGCGSALREYGGLFAGDEGWSHRAESFSARVRDVTEVLDALELGSPSRSVDETATYQQPCHLVHAQRVTRAPRRLLSKVPGLRLVEMEESALCCGSAGIYNLTHQEMASRLQQRKVRAIQRTGATVVATANPGCAIQVSAGLRAAGYRARVAHVVELVDQAFREA